MHVGEYREHRSYVVMVVATPMLTTTSYTYPDGKMIARYSAKHTVAQKKTFKGKDSRVEIAQRQNAEENHQQKGTAPACRLPLGRAESGCRDHCRERVDG